MSLQVTFAKLKEKTNKLNDFILTENVKNLQNIIFTLEEKIEEEIDEDLGSFYGSMILTKNKLPKELLDELEEFRNIKRSQDGEVKKEESAKIPVRFSNSSCLSDHYND